MKGAALALNDRVIQMPVWRLITQLTFALLQVLNNLA
jgi:hypothetical protein